MSRFVALLMVFCFVFASTAAHAARVVDDKAHKDWFHSIELTIESAEFDPIVKLDNKDASQDVKDELPSKGGGAKLSTFLCGIVLALGHAPTALVHPTPSATPFEMSSDRLVDGHIQTLKRPPRT